jgi:serine-type D-Ala-D-Ala carboxypeptidase (penicillin-binding protein 5/6)
MKKVIKSPHFKRTMALAAALVILLALLILYTRPLLAPEIKVNLAADKANIDEEQNTFDLESSTSQIGEGVRASSFLVFDETNSQVLASKNPKSPVAIASITKLMTAYVVQKHGDLNDNWAIDQNSTHTVRPLLGLTIGDQVKVVHLVNAMLIGSANDAASALGAYLANTTGKPAIELMNGEAKALGMNSTHYENPIGFDSEQNYSNAEDLLILLRNIKDNKLFTDLERKQSYAFTSNTGKNYAISATNTLISGDPELHAIKTGFTDQAGGAMITAVERGDKRYIIIVLGSPNREEDTKRIKTNIFKTITE